MSYIDVRFHFTETTEFAQNGEVDYTNYDLRSVQRIGTDIPLSEMEGIGETLGQSDRWNVGGVNATLDAMTGEEPVERNLKDFW